MSTIPRNIGTADNRSGRYLGRLAAGSYGSPHRSVKSKAHRAVRRVIKNLLRGEL